jgi:type IV pilus assembly protein PilB
MANERLPYPQDEEAPVAKFPARASDLTVTAGGNRLGEMLVDANLVSGEQIAEALKLLQSSSGKRLGRLLVELGTLDERGLARMLATQHGLEFVDLREVRPDPAATELLSEVTARELTAIPLRVENDLVVVAVSDPVEKTLEILRLNLGRSVKAAVATPSDIQRAIGNSYRALAGVTSQVQAFEVTSPGLRAPVRAEVRTAADQAPIVQVVQMVITQGLRDRASDIHIEPQEERIRVRYRIDGALHDVLDLPGTMGPGMVSRIKILGGMNIVERRRPQDGQIGTEIEGRALDIRVSTTATIWGEKVVMRLLDKSRPLFKLSELGMPEDTVQRYSALLHSPYGMVICVGPTGSGKTTTLYGSLGEINDPERNIMTIEDPVEYTFPSINQIQINVQAGVTFASGLKSILRQDPDVILIGEVRDVETARIAVQSALTGHFVLSSVHATDSASAMHRLLDMGIEDFLVASSVTAVVAQRLVRRICDHCRTAYQPSAEELSFLRTLGGAPPEEGFAHGAGCNFCANTGYLDRTGVYELMTVTDRVRELILERASHDDLRKLARAEGMRSLQDESVRLVESGVTTLAEVLRSVYVSAS